MSKELYWIWFSKLNIGAKEKLELLKEYEEPEKVFKQSKYNNGLMEELEKEKQKIEKYGIKIIDLYSEYYPQNLIYIYDAPVVLFALGNIDLLKQKSIAIVGARKCTNYGKKVAKNISEKIVESGINVISGLARGIDTMAHIGADGETIAVLGTGLDVIYPKENIGLAKDIIKKGGLIITEYGLGVGPRKMHFPSRNRIISGIAEKVVVVEAGEKSGSLITAEFALEQGKDVYAVPGNITSLQSKGTNSLIKEGAIPYTEINDLM